MVSQLQGLVNGSRLVNPKKHGTSDPAIAQAAELLGAAEAAWTGVGAALRAMLSAGITVNDKVVLLLLCMCAHYIHPTCWVSG